MLLSKPHTMHELKQLVDDRFEEPPVGPQEAGVLSHYIHDVGGHNGLVILSPLLFTQPKQVLFQHTPKICTCTFMFSALHNNKLSILFKHF